MTKLVALHSETHSDMRVKNQPDFELAKDQNILPLLVQEFIPASIEFVIAFVKPPQGQEYQAVAMIGLKPNECLYSNGENWTGLYLPSILWNSPFKMVAHPNDPEKLLLAIDEDCSLATRTGDEGELLYDADGKESAFHEARRQSVINNFEFGQTTQGFAQLLAHLDLLKQQTLTVEVRGEKFNLDGLCFIDVEKLHKLPDEQFLDLRNRGFLPVIYAHIASMQNIHRLIQKANEA